MTKDNFIFWLKGYLDSFDETSTPALKKIKNTLESVILLDKYKEPFVTPKTFLPELPDEYTWTCTSKDTSLLSSLTPSPSTFDVSKYTI